MSSDQTGDTETSQVQAGAQPKSAQTGGVETDLDQAALGRRLRQVREYLGLSQQFVTASTGIPRPAISEIERGNRKVDSLELRKLARLYQHPVGFLLGEDTGPAETPAALGRALSDMTHEDQEELLKFAQYLTFSRRGRKA